MSQVKAFNGIHKKLTTREYNGVRYVFGTKFRGHENLASIFESLRRRNFSPQDAKETIDDVLIACDYGSYLEDKSLPLQPTFFIGNHSNNFDPETLSEMEERALVVKVSNSLFGGGNWQDFRLLAITDKSLENEPPNPFDEVEELYNQEKLDLKIFREILNYMEEKKLLKIVDAYMEETGNLDVRSKVRDYEWRVSRMRVIKFGKKLQEEYPTRKDIPVNEWFWPPLCRAQYITLALVSNQSYSREDYFTHKSLHKQPSDDLPYHKKEESFEQIFPKREEDCFSTLVSGRPGIGKTVLLTKVCKDWANGKCLQNIHAFIHVSLRDLHGKSAKPTLIDLLELQSTDSENAKILAQHIESISGEGVCFAFDGLDEYPLLDTVDDIVTSIVRKHKLSRASVIITSRPTASHKVKGSMKKHAEIIGFMPEQIEAYVNQYYGSGSDKPKAKVLLDYLESHPNVKDMCFLPLHLAMIVHLNDVTRSKSLPETESDVYHRFVSHSVIRYILRERKTENEDIYIETFHQMVEYLNEEEYELFKNISCIAFHSRVSSRIIFSTQDLAKFHCQFTNAQLKSFKQNGLGIISSYRVFTEFGPTKFFSFQHLTIQEFLAAYYISQLEEKEHFHLLETLGDNPEMREVWKFFFGISKNSPNLPALFEKIAMHNAKHGVETLFLTRCIFETQIKDTTSSEMLCHQLLSSRQKIFNISNVILSAPDCSAIGFVLRCTSRMVTDLMMNYCQVGQNEFRALKRQLDDCKEGFQSLRNFQIRSQLNPLKQEGADDLHIVLSKMQKLRELRLYGNQLESEKLNRIQPAIRNMRFLQILVLTKNNLGPNCGESISLLLENYPNLIQFYASYNPLTTDGFQKLVPGLMKCTKLRRLGLRGCSLDKNSGKVINEVLLNLKVLEQLELYWNCLGSEGIRDLSDGLQKAPKLQQVSFTKNEIDDEGGCILARAVGESQSIKQIRLYYNNISSVTRQAFYNVAKRREEGDNELKYAL